MNLIKKSSVGKANRFMSRLIPQSMLETLRNEEMNGIKIKSLKNFFNTKYSLREKEELMNKILNNIINCEDKEIILYVVKWLLITNS